MAANNKATWQDMQSKLLASGHSNNVVIGPPREVHDGMIALIPADGDVDSLTLSHPREIHRFDLRMYKNFLTQPQEAAEFALDAFRADIFEDICGDFDLGATIPNVEPIEFSWDYDPFEVGETELRVINLHIAYRVDDRAQFVK